MSQIIDNLLNVNIKHASTPVPVPPTGGGTEILSPDTGFGDTVSNVAHHLGGFGCGLIIVTLLLICSATIFFCLRRTFATNTGKAAALLTSLGLFAFAFGLSVPSAVMTTGAISETIQSTSSAVSAKQDSIVHTDIDVTATDEGSIATADTKIALESTAKYGFRVFAYMDEDNTLYNRDQTASIAATTTTPSADPTTLALNSYGVKDLNHDVYVPVSTDATHPTPIFETDQAAAAGSTITLNYAVKADSTVPEDTYSPLGQSVHYIIDFATKPTITYDGNGEGVTDVPEPTVAPIAGYGKQTLTLSSQVPHKDGCEFYGWSINPSGSTILYQPGDQLELSGDITLYAIWSEPVMTAKAILGENGNLNFIYDEHEYVEGQTYTDNLGETVIKNVYPVPENAQSSSDVPWAGRYSDDYRPDITTANVMDNFYNFKPTSTIHWFYCDGYISNITDLINLNTSQVTKMSAMFESTGYNATTLSLDLSGWDTSNVTSIWQMFSSAGYNATTLSLDLSGWDTSNVTSMSAVFNFTGYNASTWSVNGLSNWNTSSVLSMHWMFYSSGRNTSVFSLDLSNWNTSNVIDMNWMFDGAGENATTWSVGDLSNWDTSKVTNMSDMFGFTGRNASTWSVGDLSNWNTSNVTNMSSMFSNTGNRASTWSVGDLSNWDTSKVTNMSAMFSAAGQNATTWSVGELNNWNTGQVEYMSDMFASSGEHTTTWSIGDLSKWDTGKVTSMTGMFEHTGYYVNTLSLKGLDDWNTSNVVDMRDMFDTAGRFATTWSIGDLSKWDTSKVTNMSHMFASSIDCPATTWSIGDLSNWNTGNVKDMSYMFFFAGGHATTWSIGDISNWDTSKVTDMKYMFMGAGDSATTISLDLSNWDTSKVTDMSNMFDEVGFSSTNFSLNISGWDTSKVTNMSAMFSAAGVNATNWSIDGLSNWDTSNVTNMSGMFALSGGHISATSLDISGWDTRQVTNMDDMFQRAYKIKTVYVGDNWSTENVTSSERMFSKGSEISSLIITGGAGTTWNESNPTDKTYARVDNPPDAPGYFTYKGSSNPVTPTNTDNGGSTPIARAPATRTQTTDSVTVPNTNSDTDNGYSRPQGMFNNNPNTEDNTPLIITLIIASVALVGLIAILIYRLVRKKESI